MFDDSNVGGADIVSNPIAFGSGVGDDGDGNGVGDGDDIDGDGDDVDVDRQPGRSDGRWSPQYPR